MKSVVNVEIIENSMKENNLTIEEFCRKCKINVTDLEKIMTNDHSLELDVILKIAKAIGIKPTQLINDVE